MQRASHAIYAAIVRISSEPVRISSELVWISSELVSRISESLIISSFRKTPKLVLQTLIPPWNEDKGELWIFALIKLVVKTAQRTISSEMQPIPKWLEVIHWGINGSVGQKDAETSWKIGWRFTSTNWLFDAEQPRYFQKKNATDMI